MHAATVFMSSYDIALLCLEGLASLVSSISTGLYNLFASPTTKFPNSLGERFDEDVLSDIFENSGSLVSLKTIEIF